MARTSAALECPTGRRAGTERSGRPLSIRLSVGLGATMKSVPLDSARETAAFAGTDDIHSIADLEYLNRNLLTLLQITEVSNSKFAQVFQGRRVGALQMPQLSARQTFLRSLYKAKLN